MISKYHVLCVLAALETILHNILTEDKYLRTYRRSISFGQNIKKDLIPLLINAKEDATIELLIRILVNLTIPIECLLSVEVISRNDFGRHTIFEINNLLSSAKIAFTDHRATKVVLDFLKKNVDCEQKAKLTSYQCTNISNSLLFLRNILHIPEEPTRQSPSYNGPPHAIQNQILWNIFSQSVDKILIKLMIISDAVSHTKLCTYNYNCKVNIIFKIVLCELNEVFLISLICFRLHLICV